MTKTKTLNDIRARRTQRSRAKIFGTSEQPRLAVFRSNRFVYAQLIDDEQGVTVANASSKDFSSTDKKTKAEQASLVGENIAKKAGSLGIKKAVFDRRHYKYHGRIRLLAEAARKAGLTF